VEKKGGLIFEGGVLAGHYGTISPEWGCFFCHDRKQPQAVLMP